MSENNNEKLIQEIETLVQMRVPYTGASQELGSMSSSPRLVPSYQDIIENVDLEPLNTIPWFGWMTALSSRLLEATENLKEVVSIKELTALKGGVSKLLLCTVMPNLPCDLPYPTASKHKYDFSHDQKLSCVDVGVRVVLVVSKSDHLRSYVMRYLGELLCALLYLNTGRATQTDSEQARAYYQQSVTSLLDESYQPTVFTHLMILLTAKGDGGRISRIARKILDTKLQREGGINALVAATLLANDSPSSDLDVTTVSNLLVSKRTDLFYRSVLPQVKELLNGSEVKGHQVAAHCIAHLEESDPLRCETYFYGPMLSPLEKPCQRGDIESTLRCLQAYVDAAPPQVNLARPLPPLCFLYTCLYDIDDTNRIKVALCKLVTTCFRRLTTPCGFVQELLFPPHPGVYFTVTPDHSVVSLETTEPVENPSSPRIILGFVSIKDFPKVKCDIYKYLLEYVGDSGNPLDRRTICTELLSELSEEPALVQALCERPQYILDFLSKIFTSGGVYDDGIVGFGLILLTVIVNDNLVHRKSNRPAFSKLVKPLEGLSRSTIFSTSSLAKEILNCLADCGIIEDKSPEKPSCYITRQPARNKGEVIECSYDEAYIEAVDPQLPVRAHAMRTLAKLIRQKDPKTLSNESTLLTLFKINLENEDSYLYLSAIEGLSSLAAAAPDQVLHQLCHEFANKKSSSIHRLKIGEVLLRTVKIMGDGGASHQDALLASFLTGVGDSDPLVRASSLSNIGEVARVFSFRIQTYIIEVLGCVERIVDCDEAPEPRRAAILLLGLLIQGLGKNALTVMGDLLPPLYRKLKQVYTEDRDEVTRLHAQVALDHFTHLMRGILLPDPDPTHTMSIQDVNK